MKMREAVVGGSSLLLSTSRGILQCWRLLGNTTLLRYGVLVCLPAMAMAMWLVSLEQVVDFGCAECKLLGLLKRELYIESLVGVDVDPVPLRVHSPIIRPLITDHLHPRPRPLYMALMEGSHGDWAFSSMC